MKLQQVFGDYSVVALFVHLISLLYPECIYPVRKKCRKIILLKCIFFGKVIQITICFNVTLLFIFLSENVTNDYPGIFLIVFLTILYFYWGIPTDYYSFVTIYECIIKH